jgi:hypothetical protein
VTYSRRTIFQLVRVVIYSRAKIYPTKVIYSKAKIYYRDIIYTRAKIYSRKIIYFNAKMCRKRHKNQTNEHIILL